MIFEDDVFWTKRINKQEREGGRERVCVWCVCVWEREREGVCVCVCKRERDCQVSEI